MRQPAHPTELIMEQADSCGGLHTTSALENGPSEPGPPYARIAAWKETLACPTVAPVTPVNEEIVSAPGKKTAECETRRILEKDT